VMVTYPDAAGGAVAAGAPANACSGKAIGRAAKKITSAEITVEAVLLSRLCGAMSHSFGSGIITPLAWCRVPWSSRNERIIIPNRHPNTITLRGRATAAVYIDITLEVT